MNEIFLTKEQLAQLTIEYDHYIQVKRPEVVSRIKEAKSFGDLSENSEYDSAREEQAFVESKIKELDSIITNAKLISDVVDTNVVSLGGTILYQNVDTKEMHEYRIVGVGANPLDEKQPSISTGTAIARGLLGKKKGDKVTVETPSGKLNLKIITIK